MERWLGLVATTLSIWTVLAGTGHTTDQAWDDCVQEEEWNRRIAGCTQVLERGSRETTGTRAVAFNNRGVAYAAKGDLNRAITDFNEAIRLDPEDAYVFNNRGNAYRSRGD